MTAPSRPAPMFTIRSATSAAHAIFLAALCAFLLTAFLVDVQRGASRPDTPVAAQRS